MDWRDHITSNPDVCHGKPCVRGTRVMVTVVLDNLAAGLTPGEIAQSYPGVSPEAVQAVVAYGHQFPHFREAERAVSRDPEVMRGALVFAGTRVPVQSLVDHLGAGDSLNDFLEGFPSVSQSQAEAFLEGETARQSVAFSPTTP